MAAMYHRYFGLQEEPFSIAVNPRYLYMSDRHRDALAHMLYGVGAGGGFVLLTGEVGTGKTTINRCLLEQLPEKTDIAIVLNPALNTVELLATVCDELDICYDANDYTLKTLTDKLHEFLLANHQRGRRTVLLIDEAQHLQFDVLEQIRLLTNLETNTQKLLQIILVGQPELTAMLARPELRQLNQRIGARFQLEPLNLRETKAYIRHRLQVAGLAPGQELFPGSVVKAVYKRSGGIPRLINLLCDRTMLGSYGQNKSRIDMAVFRLAQAEVFGKEPRPKKSSRPVWNWLLVGTIAAAAIAAGSWQFRPIPAPVPVAVVPLAPEPEPEPVSTVPLYWDAEFSSVLANLAQYRGAQNTGSDTSCRMLEDTGWRCLSLRAESWNEIMDYGGPAVITLVTDARYQVYALLLTLRGAEAEVLVANQRVQVPVSLLADQWNGEFTMLWQPPESYSQSLREGAKDPLVAWLAQQFAQLDGQPAALATEEFNSTLVARVRLFQRQQGLADDGVVGVKTLMRLQQALLRSSADAS